MTFEEYQEQHLQGQSGEFIRLVRMGWNARGSYGNQQGILDSSGGAQGADSKRADLPHASLEVMGNIEVDECGDLMPYSRALVITFDSNEAIREAIAAGKCTFGFKE